MHHNKWWRLLTTATGMTETDKAQACDVYTQIDETHPTKPQAPAESLAMASPVECWLLQWSVHSLNDEKRIIRKDPRVTGKHLSGSVDQAAAVKQRGDGEPKDGGEVY